MIRDGHAVSSARVVTVCLALLLGAGLAMLGCSEGWRGGIHAQMAWSAERGLRVVKVPAGPAKRAGLLEDDRIVAIDGVPIAGRPIAEVVAELRGEVGSHVHITVERGGAADGGVPDAAIEAGAATTEELEIERAPYARD
jgi:C-terminal processing protease CtpA/Prc